MFMGIDVGSSGCKVSVIGADGTTLAFAKREYSFLYENGRCELDAEGVWGCVLACLGELGETIDLSHLQTISVTSFGEVFVLLDGDKRVLRKAISYEDGRGKEELAAIEADLYAITGASPDVMFALPKLMWVKKHEPALFDKVAHVCMFADFILFKLGSRHHTDYSLAARTLMLDVKNKRWSDEILSSAGIDKTILGELVPSGAPVGYIDEKIAEKTKLPPRVLLLAGGHDQPCAALGAGIIKSGIALDGMGSNECIVPAFSSPMINDVMKRSHLVCVPHIVPETYVTYAFNRTAGSLFRWYEALLGGEGYDTLLDAMPDGPTDLFVLPHFAGAATPYMDDAATGAVVGLKLSTTKGELTRAIIEGLSFEMLVNISCLKDAGFEIEKLYASGGMSKSDRVLQVKADVLGIPVTRLANAETGTVGTAILGALATGVYKTFDEAVDALVKTEKTFVPDLEKHKIYKEKFTKYEKMYHSVKEMLQ